MKFVVEKADLSRDKERIMQFWKENFPDWLAEKYLWFYQQNIVGPADCWMVKENGKESIIGTAAIFPRKFRIKGKDYLAGITGDFAVAKQHRILGPALKLQREVVNSCEKGKYHFIYGFPNEHSEPVQRRAGFILVGSAIRMVKVIHTYRYIKRLLRIDLLSRILSFFLDFGIYLFAKETWYKLDKGLEGKFIKGFDERFDDLWEVGAINFPLIGERSQKFLTWRFKNCPRQSYQIFILENTSDQRLLGYLIFALKENKLLIVDCFAIKKNNVFQKLFIAFLKQVRRFKIESISIIYMGDKFLVKLLNEFNFKQRKDKINIVSYIKKRSTISDIIIDPELWYFFEGDLD